MKKSILLVFAILLALSASLTAQSHNAVPLSDTAIYDFLNKAEMKGYTSQLRAARPYPRSMVISLLEDIKKYESKMRPAERGVFREFYNDYVIDDDKAIWQDGDLRFEHEVFPIKAGVSAEIIGKAKLNDLKSSGLDSTARASLTGDAGKHVSYGLDIYGGLYKVDDYDTSLETGSYGPTAWVPYTYTKSWDGGARPLSNTSSFSSMPTELSFGYGLDTEIAASFWDNSLDLRFGRLRREWSRSEGSLFLDAQARPFMGFDGVFSPWKWVNLSFLTGSLEYGETFRNYEDYSIKGTARTQQNMLSMFQLELIPTDWLYIAITDSASYLKRSEMGYAFPFMPPLLYQLYVGDFDNSLFGGTIEFRKKGLGKVYGSLLLDEFRPGHGAFTDYRNMMSFMGGVEAVIPGMSWTTATVQYTKIEPFTYTHYYVSNSPWYYDLEMETGYLNSGESLGYGLEPNSDELMLKLESQPHKGVTATFGYKMIRHGTNSGSTFDSWGGNGWLTDEDGNYLDENGNPTTIEGEYVALNPDNDPNGAYGRDDDKNFLKDAVYEWFHIFSLGGSWDLSSRGTPIEFGLNYDYVLKYYTDYEDTANFKPINSGVFSNENNHLVTLSLTVYP